MAMYAHLAHLSVYEVNLKHMRECKNLIIYLRDYHVLNSAFISETLFFFVFFVFCFLFDSLRPINNLSVKQGRVFLGWTSTKLG